MTFNQRLSATARRVEDRLRDILTDSETPERLLAAMRHAVLGGGKRFRPFLLTESAALFGVPAEDAVDAAAALELIHCYSLVHDDLPAMDNDATRRGQPTVWTAFDEWTAILAGDALLTLAFEVLLQPETAADPRIRGALALELAKAAGRAGMVGGQQLDLEAEKLGRPARPGPEHVRRLQAMKTGALISFACEAGAIVGDAGYDERLALRRYGDALGLAFQIADDLLDATGDAEVVGKAVAKDAAAGKATMVSLIGVAAARSELDAAKTRAIEALSPFGRKAGTLIEAAEFVASRRS